jgi:hypothetical protein
MAETIKVVVATGDGEVLATVDWTEEMKTDLGAATAQERRAFCSIVSDSLANEIRRLGQ